MANRTFKVSGRAYSPAGNVTISLSINGNEVFNGEVTTTDVPRSGQPDWDDVSEMFTYTLDESVTGNLNYSLSVSGGEFVLGQTQYNGIPTQCIPSSWFYENITPVADGVVGTLEQQQYQATQVGEARLGTALYNKLMAGEATVDDIEAFRLANNNGPLDFDSFIVCDDLRNDPQVNGESVSGMVDSDDNKIGWWPILQDGDTFTTTWVFDTTINFD